jgi:hypothetical protein
MSVVRPEFGPTLPELLGPHVRALPRGGRLALAAVAALVVVALAFALSRGGGEERTTVVVREPIAYNLVHPPALQRVQPRGRETLRLETAPGAADPQSFAVTPFTLAPYRGDSTAVLTGMSPNLVVRMRRTIPGFVWRADGRVNYNRQPGYEILFQARRGGRTWYGRRTLLVPGGEAPPREGVDIMVMAARSDAIPRVDAVASSRGALKTAIRSFRFGTRRP